MNRSGLLKKRTHPTFFYLILLYLSFSFLLSVYFFNAADSKFQKDSESLAINRIVAEQNDLTIDTQGFGLGYLWTNEINRFTTVGGYEGSLLSNGYKYSPYRSQFGLQGHIYAAAAKIIKSSFIDRALQMTCIFLLVSVLLGISWQLYVKYDFWLAACFLVISTVSPWVANYSYNLYWVIFTWFIPMFLGLLCLNYEKKRYLIYPLFYISILIKCLCGYEFLSTIMMSGIMFLIVEWICRKDKRKQLAKSIIIIGLMCVLGFLTALAVHAYIHGSGNIVQGLKALYISIIQKRTFGDPDNYTYDALLINSLNASVFDVLKGQFWNIFEGKMISLLTVITGLTLLYKAFVLKKKCTLETSLFLVSFTAPVSWFVLAKSHSYIHVYINSVLLYMGYVQICVYILIRFLVENKVFSGIFSKSKIMLCNNGQDS